MERKVALSGNRTFIHFSCMFRSI